MEHVRDVKTPTMVFDEDPDSLVALAISYEKLAERFAGRSMFASAGVKAEIAERARGLARTIDILSADDKTIPGADVLELDFTEQNILLQARNQKEKEQELALKRQNNPLFKAGRFIKRVIRAGLE